MKKEELRNKNEENKNYNEESIITVNWSKEKLYDFLKTKLNIDSKSLSKISEKEIDGEALILLSKKDYKKELEIKNKEKDNILNYIEKDILKLNDNIKQNKIYEDIFTKEFKDICKSLTKKLKQLKFGEKLKYIKYLLIKNPPPEKENKNDLNKYLNTILINENIDEIIEDIDNDL